jgi:hypothetical protein
MFRLDWVEGCQGHWDIPGGDAADAPCQGTETDVRQAPVVVLPRRGEAAAQYRSEVPPQTTMIYYMLVHMQTVRHSLITLPQQYLFPLSPVWACSAKTPCKPPWSHPTQGK